MSKEFKLTKQKVRDLNSLPSKQRSYINPKEFPKDCDHSKMNVCCFVMHKGRKTPCGHWVCRGCGLTYDRFFDGSYDAIRDF